MSDRVDDTVETSVARRSVGSVHIETGAAADRRCLARRELVTLVAYLETGTHKGAAHRLGIREETSRRRLSQLGQRLGVANVTQAVWVLRRVLEGENADVPAQTSSDRARPHVTR